FDKFTIPVQPMIGVIGVAPEGESIPCGVPGAHGGNMDNTKIKKGAVLYLPVFHDGAYLALGDCHAGMGDGEIMVTGVEIPAMVSLRFEVIKGISISEPRLEDGENIYTISSHTDISKAIYSATKTMNEILQKHLGYNLNKAGMLTSLAGNLEFCQVVDPALTVRMSIPKTICDKVL
ncbi:MAG: acetamidase/formamidase family protein, partial [Oscillospiraceae bacterium]|nr:acetamidase/formamidase family protein [Oscillospiraceae bacterium]